MRKKNGFNIKHDKWLSRANTLLCAVFLALFPWRVTNTLYCCVYMANFYLNLIFFCFFSWLIYGFSTSSNKKNNFCFLKIIDIKSIYVFGIYYDVSSLFSVSPSCGNLESNCCPLHSLSLNHQGRMEVRVVLKRKLQRIPNKLRIEASFKIFSSNSPETPTFQKFPFQLPISGKTIWLKSIKNANFRQNSRK